MGNKSDMLASIGLIKKSISANVRNFSHVKFRQAMETQPADEVTRAVRHLVSSVIVPNLDVVIINARTAKAKYMEKHNLSFSDKNNIFDRIVASASELKVAFDGVFSKNIEMLLVRLQGLETLVNDMY